MEGEEEEGLLKGHVMEEKSASQKSHHETETLNLKESFFIITAMSCGSGVLTTPYIVHQLGIVPWLCMMVSMAGCICLCAYLLIRCTLMITERKKTFESVRDPLQEVAELAGGPRLRQVSVFLMYCGNVSTAMSFILLTSTIVRSLLPPTKLSHDNFIRLCATVIIALVTPLTYLENYSKLKCAARIGITSVFISLIAVIINCILAKCVYNINPGPRNYLKPTENFLIPLGTLVFMLTVYQTVPNVVVLAARPQKLGRSLVATVTFMSTVFFVAGLVPYFVFGNNVLPSTTSTFYQVMRTGETGGVFQALTFVVQLSMFFHFFIACVLLLNPCFLHMEELLNIPHGMNFRGVCVRTSFMCLILTGCLLIPRFDVVMSVVGGVPLIVLGIMSPLIFYMRLFELSRFKTVVFCMIIAVAFIFVVGNLLANIIPHT